MDLTAEQIEIGRARRLNDIRKAAALVSELEDGERQTRDINDRRTIAAALKEARRMLNVLRSRSPEDFARDAIQQAEREREELGQLALKKQAELVADEQRRKVSGNCPLKVEFATFAHLTDVTVIALFHQVDAETTLGLTPLTAIVFEVTNRATEDVVAWEFAWELLDGFDDVVATGSHKSPALTPGETKKVRVGANHVPSAVQMRIHVARAKLEDGTTWEWSPDFQEVGLLVRKMDGADLMKDKK